MGVSIRQVGPEDLPAAVPLFELKDGCSYKLSQIADLVGNFDPEQTLAWMAFDAGKPVGMTMMLIRELDVDGKKLRAGYWANLYIRPEYRQLLLYPRLTLAMTGSLRKNQLAVLYAAIRNSEMTRAHTSFGFVKLGELAVRAKPLRPARLLARYKGWPLGADLARLPDFFYQGVLKLRGPKQNGVRPYELSSDSDFSECASLISRAQSRVRQIWSPSRLHRRYAGNREGEPYSLLGARREGRLVAAVLWRAAVRGNGVRAGVLMDLVYERYDEHAAKTLLATAEKGALKDGCDVMLHLDGVGESSRLIEKAGYWSSPERYAVLLWPPEAAKQNAALADLKSWRYAFADHDTF